MGKGKKRNQNRGREENEYREFNVVSSFNNQARVIYYGDTPSCATGFAQVAKNLLLGLHETGRYQIVVLGVNYWGNPHQFPFPIYPMGLNEERDPYGRRKAQSMILNADFDILFFFQDTFILNPWVPNLISRLKMSGRRFRSVMYGPVDGVPKRDWMNPFRSVDIPVTYTNFAYRECVKLAPELENHLRVIYHGVNDKDFYPLDPKQKQEVGRKYFGAYADYFKIFNLNRNQQRKDIPRTLAVFTEFRKHVPNSVLWLHMAVRDQGWDLIEAVKAYGLIPGRDVLFPGPDFGPNQGWPLSQVNELYNAADVVVSTTLGEGFGLSSIEGMACRTPIIFPRNTALEEICGRNGERGLLADSGSNINLTTMICHDNEVIRPLTDIEHMVQKLLWLYENRESDEVKNMVESAYKWVCTELNWKTIIVPQWVEIFNSLVDSLKEKKSGVTDQGRIAIQGEYL